MRGSKTLAPALLWLACPVTFAQCLVHVLVEPEDVRGDFRGREAVGGFFQGIGEHWESREVNLEALGSSGGRVVALARINGRLRVTGEQVAYSAAHSWTIVDGTPVRFDEYVNAP